jgi:hypothetical protein
VNTDELKRRCYEDLLWVYTESLNVFGKAHTRYLQMVGTDPDTAIAAAKRMIRMSFDPGDFYLDRLDLSAEAVVVKPEYRELFTADDVRQAEEKLKWLESL